ncbi:MAG: EscU/YscU/HrcU family type III secretion system export apparatus switch protein [Peptococcaceae bacterium]|jgi:flagellar biosynthesis protein|nr:EscU/YscU/HrcU family type III secretion system export apparatus switch protein [Peptococcaceae bacterium]
MNKKAVALSYEVGRAPVVIAKGSDEVAMKIIQEAEKQDIPIQKNEILVEALSRVEIYREIPAELYQTVAEILAFIYRLDALKRREKEKNKSGGGDSGGADRDPGADAR